MTRKWPISDDEDQGSSEFGIPPSTVPTVFGTLSDMPISGKRCRVHLRTGRQDAGYVACRGEQPSAWPFNEVHGVSIAGLRNGMFIRCKDEL